MARDYAKMYSGRNRRQSASKTQYLLAGLLLLMLAVGILYFARHSPSGFLKNRPALRDRLHLSEDSAAVRKPAADVARPVAFDFYNTLPATASGTASVPAERPMLATPKKGTVKLPPAIEQPAIRQSTQGSQASPVHYVLQLGVFADQKAAARTRLNFLLAGVDSIIVRETSEGGKILFRIQQGSYLTEKAARTAGAKYRRHGVTAVVRKVVDIDATVPT